VEQIFVGEVVVVKEIVIFVEICTVIFFITIILDDYFTAIALHAGVCWIGGRHGAGCSWGL
jgi:hypothetical protein